MVNNKMDTNIEPDTSVFYYPGSSFFTVTQEAPDLTSRVYR